MPFVDANPTTFNVAGRFVDTTIVSLSVASLQSSPGYPSKYHNIDRGRDNTPNYSQAPNQSIRYSWDFGREAKRRNTTVDSITYTSKSSGVIVSNQFLDGDIGYASITASQGSVGIIVVDCVFADGSKRSVLMTVSSTHACSGIYSDYGVY